MRAKESPAPVLLEELQQIYAEVDGLHAGLSCPASTECCRFGITGRQPYVTSIELAAVERAIARRGGWAGLKRSPLALQVKRGGDERCCPLLDRNGRCSIYAERPFGCRTFFCDRVSGGPAPDRKVLRELLRRVQALAARHRAGGDVGEPLVSALGRWRAGH